MADDNFESKADEPRQVEGDQGSLTNHSLADQVIFDRYTRQRAVPNKSKLKRIYTSRYVPPGPRGH